MFYRLEILSAWPNILNFKNSQSSRNLTNSYFDTNQNFKKQQI